MMWSCCLGHDGGGGDDCAGHLRLRYASGHMNDLFTSSKLPPFNPPRSDILNAEKRSPAAHVGSRALRLSPVTFFH